MFDTLKKYFSPHVSQDEELNFLQIFKPIYVILSALGLFPQAIEFPNEKQNTIVIPKQKITINLACTCFMIVVFHSFLIIHLVDFSANSKENSWTEDGLTVVNYTIDLVGNVLFCTVSYFCVIRDRMKHITMLNGMTECWDRLAMGQRRLILGKLRVQVNCQVLGSVLVIYSLLLVVTYTGDPPAWKKLLILTTFVLPELMQFIMIAYYYVLIMMVTALLKNVEEEFRLIWQNARNDVKRLEVSTAELRHMYVKAMEFKSQVNEGFQGAILVSMTVSFHELVTMSHTMYHGLRFQNTFSTPDILECSCWIFNQLPKMYALGRSGALLKSQVDEIGRTIHNIPITKDQEWKTLEILHFSSLMSYQDATVTIYGYFPLDASLMFNIVAAAVMYLVILVQFDTPE